MVAPLFPALVYPDQQGSNRCLIATWGVPSSVPSDGNALGNTPRPFTDLNGGVVIPETWAPFNTANSYNIQPLFCPSLTERSVQVSGNRSSVPIGGTLTMLGSNDGVEYFPLHDAFGNALVITDGTPSPPTSVTYQAIYQIMEETAWIVPSLNGTGTVSVILVGKKPF